MSNIKQYAIIFIVTTLICLGIYGAARLDFYIWRQKHPDAPTWTYFFK